MTTRVHTYNIVERVSRWSTKHRLRWVERLTREIVGLIWRIPCH